MASTTTTHTRLDSLSKDNEDSKGIEKAGEDRDTQPKKSPLQLALLFVALSLAVLCQALDNTIITTAIPSITDEFNSLNDVGWYGSG